MSRVPRTLAMELIQYVKKIEVRANFWDPHAKSAFEFARQMSSPKLKKKNPTYDFKFEVHDTDEPPVVMAEFLDGTKWVSPTREYKCSELRSELYSKASDAEEVLEASGGGKDEDSAGGKGGASKGGAAAKGGGKK